MAVVIVTSRRRERSNRHDWTLLLPSTVTLPFDDVIVLGGTDAMAQSLIALGVARRWRRPSSRTDRAELTIGWADARCSVARMAHHVQPGGLLLTEIDRRRSGRRLLSARAVQRRLARAGMAAHSTHLVEPSFERPGRYLPVDAPLALRWYLRNLFISGTARMTLAGAIVSIAVASPFADQAVGSAGARLLVIATAAANVALGDTRDGLEGSAHIAGAAPLGAPDGQAGDRAIVLTSGYDTASRAVLLLFGATSRSPRAVVKVASATTTAEGTLNEHERLALMHRILPGRLRDAVPVPLSSSLVAGRVACVETCAPGPSASSLIGAWGSRSRTNRARLATAGEWLTGFAVATADRSTGARQPWTSVFTELADEAPAPEVLDLLQLADARSTSSGLDRLAVHQHYDTGPWNIHLGRDGPFVIDWEHDHLRPSDCLGPSLSDLLYFATYWYFLARRVRTPDDEERALVRLWAGPVAIDGDVLAVRRAVDRALGALDLRRDAVPAALVATWAERTLYTRRRRAANGEAIDLAEVRPYAYLGALAGAPGLFGEPSWWRLPLHTNLAAAGRPIIRDHPAQRDEENM